MATLKDVAMAAGVSFKTVSRVVNNEPNVSDGLRQRVLRAIEDLDYHPNRAAQILRTQRSRIIGLVTDRIATTPYGGKLVQGAQDAALRSGTMIMSVNTDADAAIERVAARSMIERQVEGVLLATVHHRIVDVPPELRGLPVVLVDCRSPDERFSSIVPDEFEGGRVATNTLIRKGHQRIAFINGRLDFPAARGRLAGYRQALEDAGITLDEALVRSGGWWQRDGYHHTGELMALDSPPTALFCASDRIAMGAYDALRQRGLSIPDDVAVVGFDNHEIIAAHLHPPLTTMELPYYAMGRWGLEHLLARIANPSLPPVLETIECPLIMRDSV